MNLTDIQVLNIINRLDNEALKSESYCKNSIDAEISFFGDYATVNYDDDVVFINFRYDLKTEMVDGDVSVIIFDEEVEMSSKHLKWFIKDINKKAEWIDFEEREAKLLRKDYLGNLLETKYYA